MATHEVRYRITYGLATLAVIPALIILLVSPISAQTDTYQPQDAPPPLKLISADDKRRLNASKGVKDRTKLALELMEIRLKAATLKSEASEYDGMFTELGVFHAIMDDTLSYLDSSSPNKRTVLFNYKRLEIGLRSMSPRIEVLRRNVPPERERYLTYLARNVRDARARAIEPLFSDTVLPGSRQQQEQQ